MYTQYQKGLSIVLLTSLFLQSCGNLALNGHHQMRKDAQEATSHKPSAHQTPGAPPPRQQEAGQLQKLALPRGSTPSTASRPSSLPTQQQPAGLTDWHAQVREKIAALGQTHPQKAARLSQTMLGGYQGTPAQKEALSVLGMAAPDPSWKPGLKGGMMVEVTFADMGLKLLRGVLEILVNGNKREVERQLRQPSVPARVQLPDGEWVEGYHQGTRSMEVLRPRQGLHLRPPEYHLVAQGSGAFNAEQVIYRGNFHQGLFHDNTGEAQCSIGHARRYQGCFQQGKRHGHGTLELYDHQLGNFYRYYQGTWKDDHPETGIYYDTSGQPTARLQDGVHAPLAAPSGSPAAAAPAPGNEAGSATTSSTRTPSPSRRLAKAPYASGRSSSSSPRHSRGRSAESASGTSPFSSPPRSSFDRNEPPSGGRSAAQRASSSGAFLASSIDPAIPPEVACPLIGQKLAQPERELSLEQSIEVLTTCIKYGQVRAQNMAGQEGIIVIGNTGAGKSTFVNYLAGCDMILKSPRELGLKGIKKLVTVKSVPEGGALDELMPIGHRKTSKTFMPQIETTAEGHTYCDCPGFLDNRGAEINIANAVNIRAALAQAQGVKVVILINYHSLVADRARGLTDLLKMTSDLFGNTEQLVRHAPSILLGISQAPLDMELAAVKEWLIEDTPEIMQVLADRVFLFDPLDRPIEGGWSRAECLRQIAALPPITSPGRIFRTVLTDSDEKKLLTISEGMRMRVAEALNERDFEQAAAELAHLEGLSVIDHVSVERLLSQARARVVQYFQQKVTQFRDHCMFDRFDEARVLLRELQAGREKLGERLAATVHVEELRKVRSDAYTRYQERLKKERIAQEQLEKARGEIAALRKLLEAQKRDTLAQLRSQKEQAAEQQRRLQEQLAQIESNYSREQEQLRAELTKRLEDKEEALRLSPTRDRQEAQAQLKREREQLEKEYASKQREAAAETERLRREQQAAEAKFKRELQAQQAELQAKLQAIEAQKRKVERAAPPSRLPSQAPRSAEERDLDRHQEALRMQRALHPGNHASVADSLYNLGIVYKALGQLQEAKASYEEALAMYRALHQRNHPDVALSLNNLGVVYEALGQLQEAKDYAEQALEMKRALHPGNHPAVAISLHNVGSVYKALGQLQEAKASHEEALAMRRALHPGNHPSVADSLYNLGLVYKALGQLQEAKASYEEALAMYRALHQRNHPDVALSLNNLGLVYKDLGQLQEAKDCLQEALAMKRALHPGNHASVANSLNNLGSVYKALGQLQKAKDYQEEALAMNRALHPGNHPSVATSMSNLGSVYKALGQLQKAKDYQEEALAMNRALHPGNHPSVATSMSNLGSVYKDMGQLQEAKVYLEEALVMRRALHPGNHPHVALSLNNVGSVYEALRDNTTALNYYQEALTMFEQVLPAHHRYIQMARRGVQRMEAKLARPPSSGS